MPLTKPDGTPAQDLTFQVTFDPKEACFWCEGNRFYNPRALWQYLVSHVRYELPKDFLAQSPKTETIEEYIARGGHIIKCPAPSSHPKASPPAGLHPKVSLSDLDL